MSFRCRLRSLALAAILLTVASAARATPIAPPSRLVAIGDIHGEFQGLVQILQKAGLVDTRLRWVGGSSTLVQTGDFLDRGPGVRRVMDLLMDLERQAEKQGGRVMVLLGNHEAMNLVSEHKDVVPEAYAAFADEDSEARRRQAFERWKEFTVTRHEERGDPAPAFGPGVETAWMKAHPLGFLEYQRALAPDGLYGTWLRRLEVATRVGDAVFVHGGLSPELAGLDLESLNRSVHREIGSFDRLRAFLEEHQIILPYFTRSEIVQAVADTVERGPPDTEDLLAATRRHRLAEILEELRGMSSRWMLFRDDGPLWFRGYGSATEQELQAWLPPLLEDLGAHRIVVAHTRTVDGSVRTRLEGRILLIDTGMLSSVYRGGRASALEILDGWVTAIYDSGPVFLRGPASVLAAGDLGPRPEGNRQNADTGAPAGLLLLGPGGDRLPFSSDEEILAFLAEAEPLEITEMVDSQTRPRKVLLARDNVRAHAIFHDVDIRVERARLGDQIVEGFSDSYRNQVAAYVLSRLLGMDNVPPTVMRKLESTTGSATLWIEETMSWNQWRHNREFILSARGESSPPDERLWTRRFHDMQVFDNLINNLDRHHGNILLDSSWKLWLIDHTRSFAPAGRLPAPARVTQCSRELWLALRGLDLRRAKRVLAPFLDPPQLRALIKRHRRLVALLDELIERRGEQRVLFSDAP